MKVLIAKFDADGVYWGTEEKQAKDLTAGDVLFRVEKVPAGDVPPGVIGIVGECDLPGGRYTFDRERRTFTALPPHRMKSEPEAPSLERAFYEHVKSGGSAPHVVEWCRQFERTLEAKG